MALLIEVFALRLLAPVALVLALAAPGIARAQATTTTTVDEIPFNAVVVGCGATIQVGGTVHVLNQVTQNPNGIHIASEFNPQGIAGVDQNGVTYQGTGVS